MQALIPFALGVTFTALACLQHSHSVRGLWRRSILTSVGLGAIQFLMVRWAANGDAAFWVFQVGAAIGSGLGSSLAVRVMPGAKGDS